MAELSSKSPLRHELQSLQPWQAKIGQSSSRTITRKVNVILVSDPKHILGNKRQLTGLLVPYKFLRPQDPAMELMIWEAARATAATAPYFKSFVQAETMAVYTDGSIHHNCPALVADYERRLLWKEVSTWAPDIFLSIGTGLSNPRVSPQSPGMFSLSPSEGSRPKGLSRQRNVAGLGYMWRVAPIDDRADCEEAWRQYHAMATVPNQTNRPLGDDSNVRINVEFEGE